MIINNFRVRGIMQSLTASDMHSVACFSGCEVSHVWAAGTVE